MKALQSTGRAIYAIPFAVFGIQHFVFANNMAGYVPSFIPGGIFWIYATGAALILFSASILVKKYIVPSSILLAAMLLVFILTIHLPNYLSATSMEMSSMSLTALLKDTALMGAAIFIAGVYSRKRETSSKLTYREETVREPVLH